MGHMNSMLKRMLCNDLHSSRLKTTIHSMSPYISLDRRRLLRSLLLTTGGIITANIYAEALTLTPRATEGPYYPDHLPLDQDNDLLQIKGGRSEVARYAGELWRSIAQCGWQAGEGRDH
jgi:hypothetical protein